MKAVRGGNGQGRAPARRLDHPLRPQRRCPPFNPQGEPIGTRIFGPVTGELRAKKHMKIVEARAAGPFDGPAIDQEGRPRRAGHHRQGQGPKGRGAQGDPHVAGDRSFSAPTIPPCRRARRHRSTTWHRRAARPASASVLVDLGERRLLNLQWESRPSTCLVSSQLGWWPSRRLARPAFMFHIDAADAAAPSPSGGGDIPRTLLADESSAIRIAASNSRVRARSASPMPRNGRR